jgi:hypothetical protein
MDVSIKNSIFFLNIEALVILSNNNIKVEYDSDIKILELW